MALARFEKDESAMQALQFSRKRFKKFDEVIDALYNCEDLSEHFADRRIAKVHELFTQGSESKSRSFLRKVLVHFSERTQLLSGPEHIQAVSHIVRYKDYWIRDIFKWKPASKQRASQFSELVSYLFCRYPVPVFLYKAFINERDQRFMRWYIDLGTGASMKDMMSMPIPFTQRMGHFFLQAPEKFTVTEALRWAQVKGLGGGDPLAHRIVYSWLSTKPFGDEEFWQSFLRILVREEAFMFDHLTGMIDYLREMKRENPDYSLKGRTCNSLIRQSHEWHRRFADRKENYSWKPCGIEGMRIVKNEEAIIMEELTEYRVMAQEGRAMKHCVASYSYYCANGRTAIFSLRKYAGSVLLERLATIEVNMHMRRIVQAKAKLNKPISDEAKKYMMIWKEKESLTIGPYL